MKRLSIAFSVFHVTCRVPRSLWLLLLIAAMAIGCSKYQTNDRNATSKGLKPPITTDSAATTLPKLDLEAPGNKIRFATYNIAFNRKTAGELRKELASGDSQAAEKIAEIIQRVRPDVLLLNEFDFDEAGEGINSFRSSFLNKPQHDQQPIDYQYVYTAPVNTGVDSGMDLNGDGVTGTADDAFGYGQFPGQYGMVVLSRFPIDAEQVRTFQKFLWNDMPAAQWPIDPKTNQSYYSDEIKSKFRLSSKSHWDVPIQVGNETIHFLVSHPTPPVFDGEEDRNGCRNHDEIRFWTDYVSGTDYQTDDSGVKGGLPAGSKFVIAGDQNADPVDGDSKQSAAHQLTEHPLINHTRTPESDGGKFYAKEQGGKNATQTGNPAFDTGDFNDHSVGNMHIDYCLPSKNLNILDCGVFWPTPDQPGGDLPAVSDHRLVWVDVEVARVGRN